MAFSSTVQILRVVNETREKKDKSGTYQVRYAVCACLTDDGEVEVAGNLRLSEALAQDLKPGMYRAGFSMIQVTYGDNRGDIASQVVSLVPVPVKGAAPVASSAAKAA